MNEELKPESDLRELTEWRRLVSQYGGTPALVHTFIQLQCQKIAELEAQLSPPSGIAGVTDEGKFYPNQRNRASEPRWVRAILDENEEMSRKLAYSHDLAIHERRLEQLKADIAIRESAIKASESFGFWRHFKAAFAALSK